MVIRQLIAQFLSRKLKSAHYIQMQPCKSMAHMQRAEALLSPSTYGFGTRQQHEKQQQVFSTSNHTSDNGTQDVMDFQIIKTVKNPEDGLQVRVIRYTTYKGDGSRKNSSKYNGSIFELYLAQKGAGHDCDMVYVDDTKGNLMKPYNTRWKLLPQRVTFQNLYKKL